MNVLLTCAGRRNYLVGYFQEALGCRGKVFVADTRPDAPTLLETDIPLIVPPISSPHYFKTIIDICKKHQINIILSVNDLELPLLSKERMHLVEMGIFPIISSPRVIDTCFDKLAAHQFMKSHGIPGPKTYASLQDARRALSEGQVSYPIVLKPRWGTASISIECASDDEELELAYRLLRRRISSTLLARVSSTAPEKCILLQQKLTGQEYGLDVINDLDGRYVCTFAKQKISMRAGETDKAVTVENPDLEEFGKRIGQHLGHVGVLDCDVFLDSDAPFLLEMNPRFGGGYPFSQVAGANIPAALIAWARGEEPETAWFKIRPNVLASKCSRLVLKKKEELFPGTVTSSVLNNDIQQVDAVREGIASGNAGVSSDFHPKILITCVGRRVALIDCFREALFSLGLKGEVFGTDLSDTAPGSHTADRSFRMPTISEPDYISHLLEICRKQNISFVFSVLDTDLAKLSQAKKDFLRIGTLAVISPPEIISICQEKYRTSDFFNSIGIRIPKIIQPEMLSEENIFPLFLKSVDGSGSSGKQCFKISSSEDYLVLRKHFLKPLLLEYVEGQEYTCDIYIDFRRKVRCIVPRKRLEVRAGEVSKAQIEMNPAVLGPAKRVAEALAAKGAIGVLNIQCILDQKGDVYFIEINPRFGGGCPLTIKAGYDFPKWLIQEVMGQEINTELEDDGDGLTMLRYDDAVFVRNGKRVER